MKKLSLIVIAFWFFTSNVFSQRYNRTEGYFENIIEGKYDLKSTDKAFKLGEEIKPQSQTDRIYKNLYYLDTKNETIRLFSNPNPSGNDDVKGYIVENSLVLVFEIDDRAIFRDKDDEFSFEVWYSITINGELYYTDYRPHDLTEKVETKLDNQHFLLFSQYTGYDGYYDKGYPEYFHVLFLDNKLDLIFESGELDFYYGNEFWEPSVDSCFVVKKNTPLEFQFILDNTDEKFIGTWNGKQLTLK